MYDVVVIGCGGIGLPVAVALASRGARVVGVDIDPARVAALAGGEAGMLDEGLDEALRGAQAAGRLSFSTRLEPGPAGRGPERIYVISVPTDVDAEGRLLETPLRAALAAICAAARDDELVVVRSTTPVGAARRLCAEAEGMGRRLLVAAAPDRSLSGVALAEQLSTPNVVGGVSPEAAERAAALMALLGEVRVVSSAEAAESVKLFSNAWRDAQFALANQMALFCEAAGVDYGEIRAAGAHGRFAPPRAGPVGGPCLTKDVHLLAQAARSLGTDVPLLVEARRLNAGLVEAVGRRIRAEADRAVADTTAGKRPVAAILGLAFKGAPPTLDRRGSFGVALAERIAAERPDIELRTWDPAAEPDTHAARAATAGAHVVILANDHAALNDPGLYADCAPGALVYDLCGVLTNRPAGGSGLRIATFGSGRLTGD